MAVYLIASVLLALAFRVSLRRCDVAPPTDRAMDDIAFGSLSVFEEEALRHDQTVRRWCQGSPGVAFFFLLAFLAPLIFFTGPTAVGVGGAVLFALGGGFALALALYSLEKLLANRR